MRTRALKLTEPEVAALRQAAKDRRFDVLITPAIDRLARRAALLLTLWYELEAAGVSIVAVKERIDTSTPAGWLMRTMFAGVAEFERATIVARTTAGRNERGSRDGEKGGRVPYGYIRGSDDSILINERAAAIVRQIFQWRGDGLTLTVIADRLNAASVPTPRAEQGRYAGAKWYASTVKSLLDNEHAYRGGQRNESAVAWQPLL